MELIARIVLVLSFLHGAVLVNSVEILRETFEAEFEQEFVEDLDSNDLVSAKCMKCICDVESGCNPNTGCRMDVGSLSCGPFQIKQAYWIDCGRPGGDYQTCAKDYKCAYGCVQRYMARYIRSSGCQPNCESFARIHNGGPRGCKNPNTLGYWNKIKSKGCNQNS